jgi:hypothetical protein
MVPIPTPPPPPPPPPSPPALPPPPPPPTINTLPDIFLVKLIVVLDKNVYNT